MESKRILITGATDGIGKQTAYELAKLNHNVILHGRDEQKCIDVTNEIKKKTNNHSLDYFVSDFRSKANVFQLASKIIDRFEFIDVLINNAGVYLKHRQINDDGIELTFMVNYLAHFILTIKLIPLLKNSKQGRIINVSSIAHESARLELTDLNLAKNYSGYIAYANSKFLNILFTYALARKLSSTNITVNALHPGVITTKLLYEGFKITGSDVSVGAQTPIYLSISNDVEKVTGKYFEKNEVTRSSKKTYDINLQEKIWEVSCELAGWMPEEIEKIIMP